MKKKRAKELSIQKWQAIVDNDGKDGYDYEVTDKMMASGYDCAYCYKYVHKEKSCIKCPIRPSNYNKHDEHLGCITIDHPFMLWNDNECVETAQVVLQLILDN